MVKVFHADLWGLREGEYRYLTESDVGTIEWRVLEALIEGK